MEHIVIYSENDIPLQRFDELYALLVEAFPTSERRTYSGHKKEFDSALFKSMCYQPQEVKAAMNFWEFSRFIFLEHFTVSKELRGQGIGADMLEELRRRADGKTIILEVEPPATSDIAARRINFYKRSGFVLNDFEYWQPPLIHGEVPIRLVLMSTPCKLSENEFIAMRNTLYRNVYNVSENYIP